jgi:hypothetical protein
MKKEWNFINTGPNTNATLKFVVREARYRYLILALDFSKKRLGHLRCGHNIAYISLSGLLFTLVAPN